MDKGTILGAVVGAAVASATLLSADAVQNAEAKNFVYRMAVEVPLEAGVLATLSKVIESKAPGCVWGGLEVVERLLPEGKAKVLRAQCSVHTKDLESVPSGASVEAE